MLYKKTCSYFLQNLAHFFLECELSEKIVEKIKIQFILNNIFFYRNSYRLKDNVEKYSRDRQATDDNIIRRMRFA
jgi:hypothetical protein